MTDVLGVCESWAEGVAVVRREDGRVVRIAVADIVSGKPVPPRPSVHRRLTPIDADRSALPGWQPAERADLGEWTLRASGGFSSRANSALALGEPGMALSEAVDRVTRWYDARGVLPRVHVHPGGDVGAAFLDAGWIPEQSTLLLLASVARMLRQLGRRRRQPGRLGQLDRTAGLEEATVAQPRHDPVLDDGWLATDERAKAYGEDARTVLEAGEVTFVTVRDVAGAVLARGRGAFHDDWVGVSCLWTRPDLRGAGLGSAVLASLLAWGAERGATTTYLQVRASDAAARTLCEARGYEVHHRYDYLVHLGPGNGTQG